MVKKADKTSVHEAFMQGMAAAMDSVNDEAIQKGGRATTTLTSYWLLQTCQTCQHTFRLGDEVLIDPDGTVRHSSASLPCAQGEVETHTTPQATGAFFDGLDETWPPPKNIPITRLESGHRLLAEPGRFPRHKCAVCGHTFRLHDHVVTCPCSPKAPLCGTAIHRDPLHGLHCFEAWNPGANRQKYCPVTSMKLYE